MLKQRIITALLLLPIVFGSILLLPVDLFSMLWAAVMSVAAYEWLKLSGVKNSLSLLLGVVVLNILFASVWFYPFPNIAAEWFILIAWLLIIISFFTNPVLKLQQCNATTYSIIGVVVGCVVIFSTWLAMVLLHENSPWLVLHVFGIVWVADTGAYFSGRRFGKRKLAPTISPGKSWEGVWGAMIAVTIYSACVSIWALENEQHGLFILICLIAAIASVAGDLLESVFKRASGVKDSGHILPGHGGAMDRLDSITAAAPVFAASYYLAGWL